MIKTHGLKRDDCSNINTGLENLGPWTKPLEGMQQYQPFYDSNVFALALAHHAINIF